MAIRLYHDSDATDEITSSNPDHVRQAVLEGEDSEEISPIYLESDDSNLTYENVSISQEGSASGSEFDDIIVDYAENESDFDGMAVGDSTTLDLSDGDYDTAVEVFRRITATNVTDAFNSEEEIYHRVQRDDYVK